MAKKQIRMNFEQKLHALELIKANMHVRKEVTDAEGNVHRAWAYNEEWDDERVAIDVGVGPEGVGTVENFRRDQGFTTIMPAGVVKPPERKSRVNEDQIAAVMEIVTEEIEKLRQVDGGLAERLSALENSMALLKESVDNTSKLHASTRGAFDEAAKRSASRLDKIEERLNSMDERIHRVSATLVSVMKTLEEYGYPVRAVQKDNDPLPELIKNNTGGGPR